MNSTVIITYTDLAAPSQPLPGGYTAVRSFALEARTSTGQSVTQFMQPFTITIDYIEAELASRGISEATLNIAFWNGSAWVYLLPCAGCSVDTVNNRVIVVLDHLAEFALLGSSQRRLFLPLALRNFPSCFIGPQEIEPNNLSSQANGPLCPSVTYTGYHNGASDDRDYFSLFLNTAGTITADLTNYASTSLQFALYDQTGTNLVGYAGGPPYHITYTGLAGTYYVRVYTPIGYPSATPYNLTVTWP